MNKPIDIAIAEDHLLVRQGMISLLKEYDSVNVLFDASNGKELLDGLKKHKPEIILLDL
jgi:DNA-binding NarL/FixJ family response regulator